MAIKTYKGLKAKADKLFSEVIRSTGYCEAQGFDGVQCSNQLQTMHIISRRFNATRCDTRNAFSGCAAHHRFYTDHPRQFSRFITETWAQEYYDHVYGKSRDPSAGKKVEWEERIDFLTRIKSNEITLQQARDQEE
jgi:hypothetical protein